MRSLRNMRKLPPLEVVLAASTITASWLACVSIDDATCALDRRVVARQTQLDDLRQAQFKLGAARSGGDLETAALAAGIERTEVGLLFPGNRVVLRGNDGKWQLALEPAPAAPPGR